VSYELKAVRLCPHLVVDERTYLETDMRTLRTAYPIANSSVEVTLNGVLIEDASNSQYGFALVVGTAASEVEPSRKIRFHAPRRSLHETYQVTYYTRLQSCPRCRGRRVEYDYSYDSQGKVVTLTGAQKLIQDIRKVVLTESGSNIFHKWYGTEVVSSLASKITQSDIVTLRLSQSIRTALQQYSDTQRLQERASPGQVTDSERFGSLIRLNVAPDSVDPTTFNISIVFTNRSRDLLDTAMTVSTVENADISSSLIL